MHAAFFFLLIVIACGCGGKVVVDQGTTGHGAGHGGAGGHGGSTSTGTGGGGSPVDAGPADAADGSTCDPDAMPPDVATTACFQSSYCPAPHSASAYDQLSSALGLCNTSKLACCQETIIDDIPCGSSVSSGNCCYTVFTRKNQCTGNQGSSGGGGGPPGCLPNTEPCDLPTDCCSQQCNAYSTCGPILCRPEFDPCTIDAECCEAQCTYIPNLTTICYHCIPVGQPCSAAGLPCCGTICDGSGHC